ncbi:MAG TPA: phospho-sugar mutase [Polyangiales bacterium]|nr:phospho-sugar mutase [Polyangiales bacterium]
MTEDDDALRSQVRAYIADDPDPGSAAELQALLDAGELDALRERFALPLGLGTAGLRGALGAGPGRMNRALCARATAALCAELQARLPNAARRGLAIGCDARHGSAMLAEEVAAVAAGAGFHVHLARAPLPTPVLAFAVLELRAAGGVMITASHNPASDNGYKIYLDNGAQITAPHDVALAAAMRAVGSLRALPRLDAAARRDAGREQRFGAELQARYLAAIRSEQPGRVPAASALPAAVAAARKPLRIAYTALHGVGEPLARAALAQAGFTDVHSVAEQAQPDPDFPTVAFPNPEEPGALDRALALGERVSASLLIANDPDADRLALAARDASSALRPLSGNQTGALLAEYLLAARPEGGRGLVLASIVSSPLLARIAAAHGARFELTLTGFKWICNRAIELERAHGLRCVVGIEEALGYAIGTAVRDKDGIAAAVVAAQLAEQLAARGQTLFDQLDALYLRHGVHASGQRSLRLSGVDGLARGRAALQRLRERPPEQLAGRPVRAVRDLLAAGEGAALPSTDLLIWELGDEGAFEPGAGDDGGRGAGQRVAIRPSGTEPKIKVYLDVREPVASDQSVAAARARADEIVAELAAAVAALFA